MVDRLLGWRQVRSLLSFRVSADWQIGSVAPGYPGISKRDVEWQRFSYARVGAGRLSAIDLAATLRYVRLG